MFSLMHSPHTPQVWVHGAIRASRRHIPAATSIKLNRLLPRRRLHERRVLDRPPLAFVFDIDGVLLRGPQVLPAARRALSILEGNNEWGIKIPYILLTNGGGVGEEYRCQRLTQQLGIEVRTSQYVQAHTVLKTLAPKFADEHVLVLGGRQNRVREVAEGYGFKNVYTTLDVHAWNPSVWPFHELTSEERHAAKHVDFSSTPISAIFVFHDPRNWSLDIQILCDITLSGGIVGGPYRSPAKPIELVFCNPDLLWRSDFSRPRLGQGAFKEAFQAVYKAIHGSEYPYVQYGKPTEATYRFAENMMKVHMSQLGWNGELPPVYMVGDNPESDIAGANGAGWASVLVRTGVYEPSQGPPTHRPTHEADDVEDAVKWAIGRELGIVKDQ